MVEDLQSLKCVPRHYLFGRHGDKDVLVMELLSGEDMSALRYTFSQHIPFQFCSADYDTYMEEILWTTVWRAHFGKWFENMDMLCTGTRIP